MFSILSLFVFYFIDNKKKYNYVIGESVPPICAYVAFLCSLKNISKFIYQIRDPWPISIVYTGFIKKNDFSFIFFEKINSFLIKNSAILITTLPYLESHYRNFYNFKGKIYYLRNPAAVNSFKPLPYPQIKNKIKVVFAGGFKASSKIINYLKAINLIQKKKIFSFTYYFLGKGVDLKRCQSYVKKNNLKNVYFLKSRSKNNVLKFVSKCHLCMAVVSSNKNSKFGYNLNKIADYTICGRPIILTNNLKKNCFVENYNMGFNTMPSPIKIAAKILNFKKLRLEKKKSMANNARKFALKELDIRKLYKKYNSILYENLKF
jgi:glycosyltransferase involved in cell wall biosynthesis